MGREQVERLWAGLARLGARRLIALALVGIAVFGITGLGGYYLSRPELETLYAGLDRQDVSRIGSALKEAGIPFDVNAEGTAVMVRYGQTAQARMLLAEKGLPQSAKGGYELFDKLGSLGLTSFMQEVTRVRALEGELARTIQSMRGIKAARVHIVLADEGSFRRTRQPPSASVVIRTETPDASVAAQSIRHLVSSAVPGMTPEQVTVLNSDGVLLASGTDLTEGAAGRGMGLERMVAREIQDNIRRTLTPYLNLKNFQVSVAARINTDRKQINETIFNPESRVERSVRVVRENQTAENLNSRPPTTVERNLPQEAQRPGDGKQTNEATQKREELTNYEISSKTISIVTGGYAIEKLSVAVLVNRASLGGPPGEKPNPEAIARQIAEIEALVASAAGLQKERGDIIKISAVDFVDDGRELEAVPPLSIGELLLRQSGNVINAATVLVVTLLLIWFGLRPAVKAIMAAKEPPADMAAIDRGTGAGSTYLDAHAGAGNRPQVVGWPEPPMLEEGPPAKPTPQQRLERLIEADAERAAAILKQWLLQGERA